MLWLRTKGYIVRGVRVCQKGIDQRLRWDIYAVLYLLWLWETFNSVMPLADGMLRPKHMLKNMIGDHQILRIIQTYKCSFKQSPTSELHLVHYLEDQSLLLLADGRLSSFVTLFSWSAVDVNFTQTFMYSRSADSFMDIQQGCFHSWPQNILVKHHQSKWVACLVVYPNLPVLSVY